MATIQSINRIAEALRSSDLAWLLPNLRQDFVIWNSLNDSTYYEQFLQSKPTGSAYIPDDFSPGRLALLALDQPNSTLLDPKNLLDSVDDQVIQMAIRSFNDQTLFQVNPQDLEAAGLIALALAYQYRTTNSWNGILSAIQKSSSQIWMTPITCLFGYIEDSAELLHALVQPGTSSIRYKLAIHAVLSNPIPPDDQIVNFLGLCHNSFGDPLPSTDRLLFIRELFEQRPQLAVDFCSKWLEMHPDLSKPINLPHKNMAEDINHLADNIFQIEVRRIADKSQNLTDLLSDECGIIQNLYTDLVNHFVVGKSGSQIENSSTQNLSDIWEKAIHTTKLNFSTNNNLTKQAELALTLSNQGLFDQAVLLLPDPVEPLPDDVDLLYAIAKLSFQSGNQQRSSSAASRILELLNQESVIDEVPIWGEYFSQINLGKLLLDLHKPSEASRVFEAALQICPNDANLLKMLAESYQSSHSDQEASETLRVLVSLNPEHLDYRRAFAQSLEDLGDWEAGLNERSNVIETNHENPESLLNQDRYAYAHCALHANHPELTLNICNHILSKNQEDSQALIYSGEAYLLMNETDKGMEFLTNATHVAPHLSETWLSLADAQKKIYPLKTVIETLENASQAVPGSSQIHFALGDLYLQDNAPTMALPNLQSAVEISPDNPQILVSYGLALKVLGHIEESQEVLSKAFGLEPKFPGLAQAYAKILVDLGKLEEAISPLEMLINSKSLKDPTPYLDYARCILTLTKLGSTTHPPLKALIALNEVLQIDPDLAEVKALTAEALTANGENELAFQAFREALDTSLTEDKEWFERLSFGFGCVASSIGKHDIAIAALQEAGQVNPNNPAIFMALSDAYLSANLPEDAMRSARNVLVIDGDNPDKLAWFAKQVAKLIHDEKPDTSNSVTAQSKQVPAEALTALAKAIQLAPTRTDLLVQLGNFQSSIGAHAEAQVTFASIASLDFATIDDLKSSSVYLSKIGDHSSSIACLENAISQDQKTTGKHDPSLYASLAQEYVTNHDHTSAINTLDKAIYIIPGDNSLISQKIDILLGLGQSIDALNCIESALQKITGGNPNTDLLFLASRINRSMGDFSAAIKYAQLGAATSYKVGSKNNISKINLQYRTQIAEIYRALLQPDQAYQIISCETDLDASKFSDAQSYLDFIYLYTELALETGEKIIPGIQDVQLDASSSSYGRWMAINARLMNKAGNYKQAEQLFQLAFNKTINPDQATNPSNWSDPYNQYLNIISVIEAAQDLGLWDQAMTCAQLVVESAAGEPLSHLNLARTIILKAEYNNLCEIVEVTKHKPSIASHASDIFDLCKEYLEHAKSILEAYQGEVIVDGHEIANDQIYRWQARSDIVYTHDHEQNLDPSEILSHQLTPGDLTALIYHFHNLHQHDPDSDSLTRIIKLARAYPRNPLVILHVALALYDDNPVDAMKSLQSVLEQNPYSKSPTIAFCNILLAKIALNLEEYDIAQDAVEAAIDFWQDEPCWHRLAAQICKRTADINSATQHLLEATNLAPTDIIYHMELGRIYFENANEDPRMLDQAQTSFENALLLDPKEVSALIYLANTQYLLNDLENAEPNARKALVLAPTRADIYQLLSEIAIRSNDFQEAYEYASKAIQISPKDIQSTIVLAKSLSALGRNNEAIAKLNAIIPLVQEAKSLHLERVKILRKIGGPQVALDELKTLTISYPDDFSILNALSQSYVEIGDLENAVSTALQALKIRTEKTSPNEQANLHLMIGQVLRQSGQLDQSIQHLSEAIQLAPDRLEPYIELGLARKERREYQQALQIFERATIIAPNDPRAPYQAGLALKESKDYKSSETMLRRAVSLAPNDVNMRRQLAAVVALNLVHNPHTGRNSTK
jgi:tetratricopeptide (TPR) repeat protein